MDTSWLEYCATDEQLNTFNETGYLIVENAITSELVDQLEAVSDRIDAEERAKTGLAQHRLSLKTIFYWNYLTIRRFFHCSGTF